MRVSLKKQKESIDFSMEKTYRSITDPFNILCVLFFSFQLKFTRDPHPLIEYQSEEEGQLPCLHLLFMDKEIARKEK